MKTYLQSIGALVALFLCLPALPVVLLAALLVPFIGRMLAARQLDALGITSEQRAAALASFDAASQSAPVWRSVWDHYRAPFVLLPLCLCLSRSADDLPAEWADWDNNVSINGDSAGWLRGTEWVQVRDEPAPAGVEAIGYSDTRYEGDAYYARGHHPRSWFARWVWLAWRNVRAGLAQRNGIEPAQRPALIAGTEQEPSTQFEGAQLWSDGSNYQLLATRRLGLLCLRTNIGPKLGQAAGRDELGRVAVSGIWLSIKRWKGAP